MNHYPSIFGDVLFPITPGPSSSNTYGPYCIGRAVRELFGNCPDALTITMAENGGYSDSFYSMQSDAGFILGILDMDLYSCDLDKCYDYAAACGMSCEFDFTTDIPLVPSEYSVIKVSDKSHTLTISAASLGGGEISICSIEGIACAIDCRSYTAAAICDGIVKSDSDSIEAINDQNRSLLLSRSPKPFSADDIAQLKSLCKGDVLMMGCISPFQSLAAHPDAVPPFASASDMLSYALESKQCLWECAIEYESALCRCTRDDVFAMAKSTLDTAYESIIRGYDPELHFDGIIRPSAVKIKSAFSDQVLIPVGFCQGAVSDALSIMEYSNAHGKIVCMPTGGSSGIIPSSIRNAALSMGKSSDDQVKALLTAGIIGTFYYPTHYSGSIGCQSEVGIACSMAAAADASLICDDPEVAVNAAVLAMQCHMGLICDPIEGYVQVPCFIRNMTATADAAVCANSAAAGFDPAVSLDEMVKAVLNVGSKIHPLNCLGTCSCKLK